MSFRHKLLSSTTWQGFTLAQISVALPSPAWSWRQQSTGLSPHVIEALATCVIRHDLQSKLSLQVGSAGTGTGEPGTMMTGVKLQGAERWKAWGTVALFTFLAILQNMGNFMPAYLNEKVSTCASHLVTIHTAGSCQPRPLCLYIAELRARRDTVLP